MLDAVSEKAGMVVSLTVFKMPRGQDARGTPPRILPDFLTMNICRVYCGP